MSLVLSLFPGIGMLDLAFELEGFCVVRGPDVLWGGDVRTFHPLAGKFDGIIGGPPCQSFSSLVHLVRANGHEPRFGNLIPEFERCVVEAQPAWFVMENVPQAPTAVVPGYGTKDFLLDNSALNDGTGFGLEQRRVRRFTFGMRGRSEVPSLLRWIDLCVFLLPDATGTVSQWSPDNSKEAKTRCRTGIAVVGHGEPPSVRDAKRRINAVIAASSSNPGCMGTTKKRKAAITSPDGGQSVRMTRYRLPEACRLQGLPEDFLADAPFTADGKSKAVANGVPLPMGRAIAKAVKEAMEAQ